jgi:DNA-binding IscR family transcriptional regulator
LAVLRSAAAGGPAFALSAPELAEKFRMRPSQVQKSLEKLRRNRMVDIVIGSTDGFENYRLTPSGETFVSIWQRQNQPA